MMTMYISPYRHIANLRGAMDKMIEESMESTPREREYTLAVDVRSEDDAFTIRALVPGLEADDLNIDILNNTVSIRGEFLCADEEDVKYLTCELPVGRFARTITLPVDLDSTKTEATLKNGVLVLRVSKAEEHLPKSIKVAVD
ncbi:MAG: Hsp20/alpha crystallin family protein [Chloroflexota bacterium]|nr:Hsp20/alpha crystallin family protein [Chloroflexota bacterium]